MYWEVIGYLGIFFAVTYRVPQIIKLCKTKKGDDISQKAFILQNLAYIAFIIYLFSKKNHDYLLISYEFMGISQNCLIICLKIYYKRYKQITVITNPTIRNAESEINEV